MKSISLLVVALFLSNSSVLAQCNGRYVWDIFDDVQVTSDILYGANIDAEGMMTDLYVDFYEPVGDTETERPLVILAHGGFFVVGERTAEDMVALCEGLARKGYACASMQYRLGVPVDEIDSAGFSAAVVRAVQDAKAAVRFFRKEADTYKVDTAQIFLGGTSAGGVLAVHYAYLQDTTITPPWINGIIDELGGLEGESGNPGYSTEIIGASSYAGAIKDLAWMGSEEIPLISTHGTADDVVPYGFDMVTFVLIPVILEVPITTMYGSSLIHPELDARGIDNRFFSYDGVGHVPHLDASNGFALEPTIFAETLFETADFFHTQLACYDPLASIGEAPQAQMLYPYPNPASSYSVLEMPQAAEYQVQLRDLNGKALRLWEFSGKKLIVNRSQLPAGWYLLEAQDADGNRYLARLSFN
jgi:hypothetical protein